MWFHIGFLLIVVFRSGVWMSPMMYLNLLMLMRYIFNECVMCDYTMSQSLLDGDSELEDGHTNSQVSVSLMVSV